MAVTTLRAHVNRAIDFFSKEELYFALGKSTAWPGGDSNVPVPDTNMVELEEVIGYKKIEKKHLVVPDPAGTIEYRDGNYKIVPLSEALTKGAKWVYIETTIRYDELPLGTYRQVGLYEGLEKNAGVAVGKTNLLPSEVKSAGVLEVVDNRKTSNRDIDQKEKLTLVIEF